MLRYFKYLTGWDIALITLLILLSLAGVLGPVVYYRYFAPEPEERMVIIQVEGEEYMRLNLEEEEDKIIEVAGLIGISEVELSEGRVRMKSAPPPDHYRIAVDTGWISRPGPMIVNMPNRVAVWIEESSPGDLDGVTW